MENPKQDLLQRLRDATNVLVTVTSNPSVDQLAGAIGLTLLLNRLGKHATAIYSGNTPDVLEFLKPENTLEKNTDSLRDFIIALDKAKADKLRYKVEDTMVKIFITPYHSALTEKDLEFSQGDYNVDLVVAIGAHQPQDLDQAIVSHGRILHDAVVSSINNNEAGNLGTINWVDANASSLCEMIYDLIAELQPEIPIDPQMSTALLTGIVSETRRFGNDKTTAKSLETSSLLVAAGANQQLVAAKLEEKPAPIPEKKTVTQPIAQTPTVPGDTNKDPEAVPQTSGTVSIDHDDEKPVEVSGEEIHIDDQGQLHTAEEAAPAPEPVETASAIETPGPKFVSEPPSIGGPASAGSAPAADAIVDPLNNSMADNPMPLLSHDSGPALHDDHSMLPSVSTNHTGKTLSAIEQSVASPHLTAVPEPAADVDAARNAVNEIANVIPDYPPKPQQSLNAQHIDLNPSAPESTPVPEPTPEPAPVAMPSMTFTTPQDTTAAPEEEATPPPVPPPMMPQGFGGTSSAAL